MAKATRRTVSISDLMPDFDHPFVHLESIAIGARTTLAIPNPDRFCIGFQLNSGTNAQYGPWPGVTTTFGLMLMPNVAPTFYNFKEHAILVPAGWYARAAGAATVTVVEVLYKPRR